jgi:hypothetical protein
MNVNTVSAECAHNCCSECTFEDCACNCHLAELLRAKTAEIQEAGFFRDRTWYEENDPQSLVDLIREHNSSEPKITDEEAVSMVNQANHEASGYPWF